MKATASVEPANGAAKPRGCRIAAHPLPSPPQRRRTYISEILEVGRSSWFARETGKSLKMIEVHAAAPATPRKSANPLLANSTMVK